MNPFTFWEKQVQNLFLRHEWQHRCKMLIRALAEWFEALGTHPGSILNACKVQAMNKLITGLTYWKVMNSNNFDDIRNSVKCLTQKILIRKHALFSKSSYNLIKRRRTEGNCFWSGKTFFFFLITVWMYGTYNTVLIVLS